MYVCQLHPFCAQDRCQPLHEYLLAIPMLMHSDVRCESHGCAADVVDVALAPSVTSA